MELNGEMIAMIPTVPFLGLNLRRKRSFPFYHQHDSADCGPTCLRMVARYYGKSYSLQGLRDLAGMDRQGVSLLGISEAAERIGFRTLAAKITPDQLFSQVPLPCIAHWRQDHFVVVYAIRKERVYVADPAIGLISYTRDEFLQGWLSVKESSNDYGVLLLLEPTPAFFESEDEQVSNKGGFGLLWSYINVHRKLISQLFVGVAVVGILQLIFPFLTKALVDVGIAHQDMSFVYVVLLAQLMLIFSNTAVEFIQSWIVLHVSARVDIFMISDFLAKLMRLPLSFFDAKTTGDLLQRIQDHYRIRAFLSNTSINVVLSFFSMFIFGIVLAIYSISIFFIFAGGSLVYVAYICFFLKRRKDLDYKRFSQMADNQNLLIESIHAMPEIKLNNAEQQKRWDWEQLQARLFNISLKSLSLDQYQQGGAVFLNQVKNVFITIVAAQQVIEGSLTLGTLLAIQYIIGQLNAPLDRLIGFLQDAQDAKLSLDRLNEVRTMMDEEKAEQQQQFLLDFVPGNASIQLQGLSFRYGGPQNNPVLDDLNLVIPQGKVTAIVGTSGSGKTTLMKLLLKFYDTYEGDIALGGISLRNFSHRFWREQCGVVLQDGHIFSDTIANNIALGEETIDKERLLQAVEIACIRPLIESLPLGYNTKIGREGIGLSKGQQQRLLIARAIYKNPSYLFFDEATSALDAETERTITENLQHFFQGRTVVVIAHRLSTVRHADQIVVLERGRIIERGVHDDLVARQGRYYQLVKNQLELGA